MLQQTMYYLVTLMTKTPFMKRWFLFGSTVILVASCSDNIERTKPFRQDISESVYASGIIKSKDQYQIMATVTGLISNVSIHAGDSVKAGEEILTISNLPSELLKENAELAAQYNDLRANQGKLDDLKLNLDFSKTKMQNDSALYFRQKNLWEQQIGSKVEFEQKELTYKNSKTNYQSAILKYTDFKRQLEFNSEQAKNNLKINAKQASDFVIKSEINGILYELNKEKGELISPQSILGVVGSASEFLMELQVDESDILKVQLNQKVLLSIESSKDVVYEGTVSKINPYLNDKTKTFTIEATFLTKPNRVYPNTTLEANIVVNSKKNALLIPRAFLLDNDSVMLPDKKKIRVKTGIRDYQNVEILDGLTNDTEIIIPKE